MTALQLFFRGLNLWVTRVLEPLNLRQPQRQAISDLTLPINVSNPRTTNFTSGVVASYLRNRAS
jgi:hypothetical protein